MRLLFELDKQDYDDSMPRYVRPSVRAIMIRDGKVALVHSGKYDYYNFPGGGIEGEENHSSTLLREIREETGLTVIPETIREYGRVRRVQKRDCGDVFEQENYFYFCQTLPETSQQMLDDYEAEEHFTLEYVLPQDAITVNRNHSHGEMDRDSLYALMMERDARILELLMAEGYL